jgi:hypothetical protein
MSQNGSEKLLSHLEAILLIAGFLLLAWAAFVAIWPGLETANFARSLPRDNQLQTLECPVLIGRNEQAEIRATIRNTTTADRSLIVQSSISQGHIRMGVWREREILALPAGGQEVLRWPVSAEDGVFDRIIMARVIQLRNAPLPQREAACGILILDLPFGLSGRVAFGLALAVGVGLAGFAIFSVLRRVGSGNIPLPAWGFLMLPVLSLLAVIFGLQGAVWSGGVILVGTALLIVVLLERSFAGPV